MSDVSWRERADELEDHGVPTRRSQVVALIESGKTHAEVADALGFESRGNVWTHLENYREQLDDARWLCEEGPDV